ncbi:MAG: LuxR C-terminal-related transcriptional regulator [Gracilibacteraceae bacterium]|nr:LuxR C-terminal-related transcriptional regulator [Gracilibacteraceae bacterium]
MTPDDSSLLGGQVSLSRPRVDLLLEQALRKRVVAVVAGAGYGKTQAVYEYLRRCPALTVWLQLSERDNIELRFWENFSRAIRRLDANLASALRRDGFAATPTQSEIFRQRLTDAISGDKRYIMVFDDFHLLRAGAVLDFIAAQMNIFPNIHLIFVSRARLSYNMSVPPELIAHVTANDLCFTENEISLLLQKLKLDQPRSVAAAIRRDTGGWAFAVSLAALSLQAGAVYEHYARPAMRRQIFKLIEREIFTKLDESAQTVLLQLSLLTQLPLELVRVVAGEKIAVLDQSVSFIHYDAYLDAYHIHHLFLEFLQEKQAGLSAETVRSTLCAAARWSDAHGQNIDAISYYEKAGEYDAIINSAREWNMQVPPASAAFILAVLDAAPPGTVENNVLYYVLRVRLIMSLGRLDEALRECAKYAQHFSALPPSPFNNRVLTGVYEAIAVTTFLTAPETDRYDFDRPMAQADYYYLLTPYGPKGQSTKMSIGPWASMVGTTRPGAQEEFIAALARTVPHAVSAMSGCMGGLDDLARGELLFYQGDLKNALRWIESAKKTAELNGQPDIVNRALFYLLRIAAARGDTAGCAAQLREVEAQLDCEEYLLRQPAYDIVTGWYYVLVGRHRRTAEWLRGDLDESALASFLAEFANMIRMKIYYAGERYYDLLAFLEGKTARNILFGKLERKVLQAVCLYQIKQPGEALAALAEAYALAANSGLDMPFIEMGKDMRTLSAAAKKSENSAIPSAWLEKINRKSTTYAKRQLAMSEDFRLRHKLDDEISLTPRERDVLVDLYHGLSRSESAIHLNLSVNTVKSLLNMVYIKLGAETTAEALRAAMEKKLL